MIYRVVYTGSFIEDLDNHLTYLRGERVTVRVIDRWYRQLRKLVDSLDESPKRYSVDRALSEALGRETRKVNFGNYLVSYQVDDERRIVNLIAFMHGARRREG